MRTLGLALLAFVVGCGHSSQSTDTAGCLGRLDPPNPDNHGIEVIGAPGSPNLSVCTAQFIKTGYDATYNGYTYQSDTQDLINWFCSTDENSSAFAFTEAFKAILPDYPMPVEGSGSADYSTSNRSKACAYLRNHHDSVSVNQVFAHVIDNRGAQAKFNQCISLLTQAAQGGGLTASLNTATQICTNDSFSVVVQWHPPSTGRSYVPKVRGVSVLGPATCCPPTIDRGYPLDPQGVHVLTCTRTGPGSVNITIHTHSEGDVSIPTIPAYQSAPSGTPATPVGPTVTDFGEFKANGPGDMQGPVSITVPHGATDCTFSSNDTYNIHDGDPAWNRPCARMSFVRQPDSDTFVADHDPSNYGDNHGDCRYTVHCWSVVASRNAARVCP